MTRGESVLARTEALEAVLTPDLVREEDRAALTATLDGLRSALEPGRGTTPLGIVDLTAPDVFAPAWDRYADLWEISELVPQRGAAAASSEAAMAARSCASLMRLVIMRVANEPCAANSQPRPRRRVTSCG